MRSCIGLAVAGEPTADGECEANNARLHGKDVDQAVHLL